MVLLSNIILRMLLMLYLLPFALFMVQIHALPLIKTFTPKYSYVQGVHGTEEEVAKIEKVLQEFNSLTSTELVPRDGLRPITITVVDNIYFDTHLAGQARVALSSCDILIVRSNVKLPEDFKNTVIHEYLHWL